MSHIGYCQEFHGDPESKQNYNKYNAYRGAQRKRIIRKKFKHLKQIYKPNLRVENRVALENFCRFVVPEYQY